MAQLNKSYFHSITLFTSNITNSLTATMILPNAVMILVHLPLIVMEYRWIMMNQTGEHSLAILRAVMSVTRILPIYWMENMVDHTQNFQPAM